MAPKSIFRQPGARHFQLVHRSQRDPLINDPEASQHVLKPIIKVRLRFVVLFVPLCFFWEATVDMGNISLLLLLYRASQERTWKEALCHLTLNMIESEKISVKPHFMVSTMTIRTMTICNILKLLGFKKMEWIPSG